MGDLEKYIDKKKWESESSMSIKIVHVTMGVVSHRCINRSCKTLLLQKPEAELYGLLVP